MSKKEQLDENMFYADLQPVNRIEATNLEGWESSFKNYLAEVKKDDDEKVKAEEKKTSKHVEEVNSHNYDYQDYKNLDNQIGEEVRKGIYYEAKCNPDKSLEEIKKIVENNLNKDSLFYVKEGQFGVKGLGYTESKSEEVSGAHKASGYSDKLKEMVKESLAFGPTGNRLGGVVTTGNPHSFASQQAEVINQMMNEEDMSTKDELEDALSDDIGLDEFNINTSEVPLEPVAEEGYDMNMDGESSKMEAELEEEKEKEVKKDKDGKSKKESIQNVMSRIERVGTGVALEAKINAIDEEINARNEQLSMLDENEAMAALMDKGKIKDLRKEMKLLEKQKGKYDKMYEKATGKKRTEIVDETEI